MKFRELSKLVFNSREIFFKSSTQNLVFIPDYHQVSKKEFYERVQTKNSKFERLYHCLEPYLRTEKPNAETGKINISDYFFNPLLNSNVNLQNKLKLSILGSDYKSLFVLNPKKFLEHFKLFEKKGFLILDEEFCFPNPDWTDYNQDLLEIEYQDVECFLKIIYQACSFLSVETKSFNQIFFNLSTITNPSLSLLSQDHILIQLQQLTQTSHIHYANKEGKIFYLRFSDKSGLKYNSDKSDVKVFQDIDGNLCDFFGKLIEYFGFYDDFHLKAHEEMNKYMSWGIECLTLDSPSEFYYNGLFAKIYNLSKNHVKTLECENIRSKIVEGITTDSYSSSLEVFLESKAIYLEKGVPKRLKKLEHILVSILKKKVENENFHFSFSILNQIKKGLRPPKNPYKRSMGRLHPIFKKFPILKSYYFQWICSFIQVFTSFKTDKKSSLLILNSSLLNENKQIIWKVFNSQSNQVIIELQEHLLPSLREQISLKDLIDTNYSKFINT